METELESFAEDKNESDRKKRKICQDLVYDELIET